MEPTKPSLFGKDADDSLKALCPPILPVPHSHLPTAVQWSAEVVLPWQFWPSLQQNCSLFYLPYVKIPDGIHLRVLRAG